MSSTELYFDEGVYVLIIMRMMMMMMCMEFLIGSSLGMGAVFEMVAKKSVTRVDLYDELHEMLMAEME